MSIEICSAGACPPAISRCPPSSSPSLTKTCGCFGGSGYQCVGPDAVCPRDALCPPPVPIDECAARGEVSCPCRGGSYCASSITVCTAPDALCPQVAAPPGVPGIIACDLCQLHEGARTCPEGTQCCGCRNSANSVGTCASRCPQINCTEAVGCQAALPNANSCPTGTASCPCINGQVAGAYCLRNDVSCLPENSFCPTEIPCTTCSGFSTDTCPTGTSCCCGFCRAVCAQDCPSICPTQRRDEVEVVIRYSGTFPCQANEERIASLIRFNFAYLLSNWAGNMKWDYHCEDDKKRSTTDHIDIDELPLSHIFSNFVLEGDGALAEAAFVGSKMPNTFAYERYTLVLTQAYARDVENPDFSAGGTAGLVIVCTFIAVVLAILIALLWTSWTPTPKRT